MKYLIPENWTTDRITIHVIGAGGTGSEVLDGLARMSMALSKIGGEPFDITIYDGDTVSNANVGRQRFAPADVGQNKAVVLAHRYNLAFGLGITAVPKMWERPTGWVNRNTADLFVTCTDSAQFRLEFGEYFSDLYSGMWLDFGNDSHKGQVVLGARTMGQTLLPTVADLYPELAQVDDTEEPSCSLEEALVKQDFGVNRFVADAGMGLLWNLIRHGSIEHHGAFIDQRQGAMQPLKIDKDAWQFMGYEATDEAIKRLSVGSTNENLR